jgi:magnesium transporter
MITRHQHNSITWIDVNEPTSDEISELSREFHIEHGCSEQLGDPSSRSKSENFGDHNLLTLHFPDHPSKKSGIGRVELDCVIGKNYLITVHYGRLDSIDQFSHVFESYELMTKNKTVSIEPIYLAHDILRIFYHGMRAEIMTITGALGEIEEKIFTGNEEAMVQQISTLRRKFIDIKHATRFHEEVLQNLIKLQVSIGDKQTTIHDMIMNQYYKMQDSLEADLEIIRELRETNDSLLSAKNNSVMKRLTLMAFITFPLSLVALLLLDPQSPHIFHGPYGFWIVIGILAGIYMMMHTYFAYKKWI